MSMRFTRRFLLGGMATIAARAALAEAPLTSVRPVPRSREMPRLTAPKIEDVIARAELGGKVGFVVADAQTGQILETHNPLLPLPPASVAKAVTAVYGLDALGADYRFTTRLIATGPVEGGRIAGDLVLVGGGDPVLDTDALGEMARALKAAGVREVSGKFAVYAGALPYERVIDPGQPDHLGYNPAVSGMNLNFNRVHFQWVQAGSDYTITMDARAQKYRPEVSIARMDIVDRALPVYTYSDAGDVDSWTVARSALGDGGSRWLPVRRPDLYAAEVFATLARAHGIVLPRAVETKRAPQGSVLVNHDSASLGSITRLMLKHSTNLTAEVIGLTASASRGRKPRSLAGSARTMSSWMKSGLGARHAKLKDHSGLSDDSRISASDMVKMLVKVGPDGALHNMMKEVAPLNEQGKRIDAAPYGIRAKTGSLNFVSSLAGYVTPAAGGRPLAFAIFTGDMPRRNAIKRADRERPDGARGWGRRSRWLQHQLIRRWVALHS